MTTRSCLALIAVLLTALSLKGQEKRIDLFQLAQTGGLSTENRIITPLNEDKQKGIRFSSQEGDGVAWLNGVGFSGGTIELDIRGKDVVQQSFVGIAFHGINKDSLEAIYFRPFNFRSADPVKKAHAVEYIFQPDFPWERLRQENPGLYEKGIDRAPLPDQWFHVRIVIHFPEVNVYANRSATPSLTVRELSTRGDGRIGLWVGNQSDGDFANLTISDR